MTSPTTSTVHVTMSLPRGLAISLIIPTARIGLCESMFSLPKYKKLCRVSCRVLEYSHFFQRRRLYAITASTWRTAIWNCASTGKSFASLDALSFFFLCVLTKILCVKYAVTPLNGNAVHAYVHCMQKSYPSAAPFSSPSISLHFSVNKYLPKD